MKRGSTFIMRCSIFIAGIVMIAICSILIWITFTEGKSAAEYYVDRNLLIITIGTCAAALPYFIALQQTLKLLGYIDTNHAFTILSVKALKSITYCAITVFIICMVGGVPFYWVLGRSDGNPGMVLLALILAGFAFVIAVFAFVLNRLLGDAIAAKSENDLTI